jgi:hypothetical protein
MQWCRSGVTVGAVAAYLDAGLKLSDVRQWRDRRRASFPTSTSVIAWHRTGLGISRARVWRDLQITPTAAARYHAAGWDVHIDPTGDDARIYRWVTTVALDEDGWEQWLRTRTTPAVVMLAHAYGLSAADLAGLVRVTTDPGLLTLAIRAGYDAAELKALDLANPDTLTSLAVAAALNAHDDGQVA